MTGTVQTRLAALIGVVSAAVVLAVAEVLALMTGAAGSPLFAVGSGVIDLVPGWVKELVISLFGTNDKVVLLTVLGIVIVALAALAGVVETRRPPWGVMMIGAGAVLGVVAVLTRTGATGVNGVPTIVGGVAGIVVLRIGTERLRRWRALDEQFAGSRVAVAQGRSSAITPPFALRLERRRFLTLAIFAGSASVLAGIGARTLNATSTAVQSVRSAIKLPGATTVAPAVPATATLDVTGISPLVTANADFYRIDTALQVPSVDSDTWSLKVTGMVENPIEISFKELLAKPLTSHYTTIACVSNDVGGNLIGNALWLGYPIRELLAQAKPKAGADMVLSTSIDGFTAGTPLSLLEDVGTEALLAVGMNGKPLPVEHGFPVRMIVPGLYGYVSATKWVVELKVTKYSLDQGYWTPRGWDAKGPIKLASRIDTPTDGSSVQTGTVPIAGVAWAQHVGVSKVEVQVDKEPWEVATLADSISEDTWRQWVYQWPAKKGSHVIQVRATDANGKTQSSTYRTPDPNGSEGWHAIDVQVD